MLIYFILPVMIIVVMYLLYTNGLTWIRMGSARLIWRRHIPNGEAAICKKANFTMTKVKRFKESGEYLISLDVTTQQGSCKIEILDCDHNLIVSLNEDKTSQIMYFYANEKYYLRVSMMKFYGEYQVRFKQVTNNQDS